MAVTAASFPGLSTQTGFARFRRELRLRRWGELHRRLQAQPVFAACSRQEIKLIARWGDEVRVGDDCLVWREGGIGYHFVVVESGALTLSRKRHTVGVLGPGDFTGEVAIVGFGPQPATLKTSAPSQLFVIGRAPLLSLVHMPGVRQGVLGLADEAAARERVRAMRDTGRAAWTRVAVPPSASKEGLPKSLRFHAAATPTTPSPWPAVSRDATASITRAAPMSLRLRAVTALAVAVAVLVPIVAVAVTARPRVGVVTPGAPINLAGEVAVEGVSTTPIRGQYVLTSVHIRRPTYLQWVVSRIHHDTTAKLAADQDAASSASHDEFVDAKRKATSAALAALSLDPRRLRVRMQPLDLGGSSVSLIYALTIVDLVDPADLARGRVIAATGQLGADGRVGSVRFVEEKVRVAHAAGAVLFLVPPGQAPRNAPMRVVEVATLADAIAVLRDEGRR